LCRASTSWVFVRAKDVDGRDTPGTKCPGAAHDDAGRLA
jgi:hypothetical protein